MTNRERLIEEAGRLPEGLAGEVLDFLEFVRAKHASPDVSSEDRTWLEAAAHDLTDRLAMLEADVDPAAHEAWLKAMDDGATPVRWDEQSGTFVETAG